MRSVFVITCRTVRIYHLNSQVENPFIHSLHGMGNWRNVATTIKQTVKKKKKKTKKTTTTTNKTNIKKQTKKQINKVR